MKRPTAIVGLFLLKLYRIYVHKFCKFLDSLLLSERWENWTYNDGTDSWSWVRGGASPTVSWAGHKDPSTNDMTFEWGVPIADLGITAGSTVRFGFVVRKPEATSNNDLLSITIRTPEP